MKNRKFTSGEVVSLTGITLRQLQWWDERGIVVPIHESHRRLYSCDDLAEVAVICELRKRGFSLQRIRKVMRLLQREFGKTLVEAVTGGSDYHLLTDGAHIYVETSTKQIIDILKNSRQPMLTICISDAVRKVFPELRAVVGSTISPPRRALKDASSSSRRNKNIGNKALTATPARDAGRTGSVSTAAFRRGRSL